MQCRNCDEMGHSSRECPKPRDYSKVQCKNCNECRFASELQLVDSITNLVVGHTVVRCKAPKPEGDSSNAAGGGDGWGNDAGTTKPTNGDEEWIKGEPAGNNW
jgi:hypothetical protein